jgi:hypothetical protein
MQWWLYVAIGWESDGNLLHHLLVASNKKSQKSLRYSSQGHLKCEAAILTPSTGLVTMKRIWGVKALCKQLQNVV